MAWIEWRDRKRGRRAYVGWRDPTTREVRRRAAGTADPRALEILRRAIERTEEELGGGAGEVSTDARELVRRFLADVELRRSPATLRFYREKTGTLLEAWGDVPVTEWSRRMLEALVAVKKAEGLSPRSLEIIVATSRRFVRWAEEAGEPVPDFVGTFRGPRVHRARPTSLEAGELDRLLEAARTHGRPPGRYEVAVALAGLAGLRLGELLAARVEDVDRSSSPPLLRVRGSKVHADRAVPISARLLEVLDRHPGLGPLVRVPSGNLHRTLGALCRAAGVRRIGFHALRHSFASLLLSKGASVATVKELLGHSSIATTDRYLHASPRELASAVELLA